MKRLLILSITILVSQTLTAIDYVVYGAGTSGVDGTYVDSGETHDGYPVYEYGDYYLGFNSTYNGGDGEWAIAPSSYGTSVFDNDTYWLYYTDYHANTPGSNAYAVWNLGSGDPPVILAAAYNVADAGTSAVNGLYVFEGTYNAGVPEYIFGTWRLGYSGGYDDWEIVDGDNYDNDDYVPYYSQADVTAYPTDGWHTWTGGGGTDPVPTVTEADAPAAGPGSPSPSNSATGVSLSGNATWNFSDGTNTYDLWFGPTGNMSEVVTGGTGGATGSYSYSGLDYNAVYQWQVIEYHTGETINGDVWSFTTIDQYADNPSPADDATDVAITTTFNWDDVPGADSYTITIGTTTGGTDIVDGAACAASDYTYASDLIPGTEYFWKVSTIISGTPYVGTEWSFTTVDGKADNPGPSDGDTHIAGNVTLNWDDMPQATGYTIDIGTSSGASDVVNGAACATSQYTPISNLELSTTYYWTVSSIINSVSYEGDEWSFTTSSLYNNQISSLADLSQVTQNTGFWDKDLVQTANIDASATQYWDYIDDNEDGDRYNDDNDATSAGTNDGWSPIGNSTTYFTGSYDGGSHTIGNLYISRAAGFQGFFGEIDGASVINLGLTNINYTVSDAGSGFDSRVGGFCGSASGSGNKSFITNCYTTGSINSGYGNAGGFIGVVVDRTEITRCYTSVSITVTRPNVFRTCGFAGTFGGIIRQCYSTGSVTNVNDDSGGFGFCYSASANGTLITDCYATGNLTRASGETATNIAAFVSCRDVDVSTVQNCYSTGNVYFEDATDPTDAGFSVGSSTTTFSNNFFNSTTSNQTSATGATALTNSEMKDYANFTDAGWDFNTIWSISPTYNNSWPNLDEEAETIDWTGASGTNWGTDENWDGDAAPSYIQNANIPSSGVTQFPVVGSGNGYSIKNLSVNSGANLTIESGGSLITWGNNNGNIDMKRTISDGQWHLVSVPASGITANTFLGDYLQSWDETTGLWSDITDPETVLSTNQGYLLWGVPSKTETTYTFTGTPLTGNQSKSLTYTEVGSSGYDGANLLGNPYPSSIDWGGLDDTWGAVYYYNGTGYVSWNNGSGSGSRYIPPMQGFFIVVNQAGTFQLTNDNRTHSGATGYYKSGNALNHGIILEASNGDYLDAVHILFRDEATNAFDLQHDAWKFLSNSEGISEIYSFSGEDRLSIDARPETQEIQLGFANDQAGAYSIGMREMDGLTNACLEDTKTGIFHNLANGGYNFAWDPMMDDEKRFILHLNAVGIEETPVSESDIQIYAANKQIFIKGTNSGKLMISDVMGRVVLQHEINGNGNISVPVNLKTGIYVVMVQSGDEIKTEKVFIK